MDGDTERASEDRTQPAPSRFDLVAIPAQPLVVKRRKILTVEASDDQPRL